MKKQNIDTLKWHLQILWEVIYHCFFTIVLNLLPYSLIHSKWYRHLMYWCTYNKWLPINIDLLYDDLDDYSGDLDAYAYYEQHHI